MNITLFDSWNRKFSGPIVEHWEKNGHNVRFNPKWEEAIGADLNFFYQADNVAVEGTTNKKLTGKTFVQCVDIEVWAGQAGAVKWDNVDGAIFMAEHIKRHVEGQTTISCPKKLIKPGIDLKKFTLRPSDTSETAPTRKIAYVVGNRRIWDVKRFDIALQMLRDLLDADPEHIWQLHVRGTYSSHAQYNAYCQYLQKDLKLDNFVVWYEDRVEDLNKWLDDKDFFFLPSTKEAFSYATAEAMAKGIKPILNNWESCRDNWAPYVCETYGQMLAEFLKADNKPEEYRQFIEDNYSEDRYLKELDEFMNIPKGGEKID